MNSKNLTSVTFFLFLFYLLNGQEYRSFSVKYLDRVKNVPITNIRDITQDRHGFMWIATQDGLFRYDSQEFNVYNTNRAKKFLIQSQDISSLHSDSSSNMIWCTGYDGWLYGVNCITGLLEFSYNANKNESNTIILFRAICYLNGSLYITSSNGVYSFSLKERKIAKLLLPERINIDPRLSLIPSFNKLFIFSTTGEMHVFTPQDNKLITVLKNSVFVKDNRILEHVRFSGDTTLIASSKGVLFLTKVGDKYEINYGALPFQYLLTQPIHAITKDKKNRVWVSTSSQVLKMNLHSKNITIIRPPGNSDNSEWLKSVYSLFCDFDDNIWLGSQNGIAYVPNNAPPFVSYFRSAFDNTQIKHAYYLFSYNDSVFYACAENGLYGVNLTSNRIDAIKEGIPFDYIGQVFNNQILTSSEKGLYILKNNQLLPVHKIFKEFNTFKNFRINSAIPLGDSAFLLGTENKKGVLLWNFKKKNVKNYYQGTSLFSLENVVNRVIPIGKELVCILGDEGISIVDFFKKKLTTFKYKSNAGKRCSYYMDLCSVKERHYLAVYGVGVIILDQNFSKIGEINSTTGLSNNGVYKVLPWKDSLLFITSNNGLNSFNIANGKITTYYDVDGLQSNVFEETSGTIYKNTLFAGGANGFTAIYPNLLNANKKAPSLYVDRITLVHNDNGVSDSTNLLIKKLDISNTVVQANIFFSAINYSNSERTKFFYRIRERTDQWIDNSYQNFVSLTGVAPGAYTLEVKAANEDGYESAPISLTLRFLPKWYQTLAFKFAVILLVAGLLWLLYRFRIRQLKKVFAVRQKISQDLHDDVSSTLSSINMYSQVAKMQTGNDQFISSIEENAREALEKLDDIVWSNNPKNDHLQNLVERIDHFARPLMQGKKIQYQSIIEDGTEKNLKLNAGTRQNLYLICKEALNNTLKYANCTNCSLSFHSKQGRIFCRIQDDGKGFDTTVPTERNGLLNMKQRANSLRGRLNIDSIVEKGTIIDVELPL